MAITGRRISFNSIRLLVAFLLLFLAFLWANAQGNGNKITRFDNLQIRADHPRIWIDANKKAWLKDKCKGMSVAEVRKLAGPSLLGASLTYIITGDEKTGRSVIDQVLGKSSTDPLFNSEGSNVQRIVKANLTDMAFCYDWCFPLLTAQEKTEFRNLMVPLMKKQMAFKRAYRSFHNGLYSEIWPVVTSTLALYGDEPFTEESWAFIIPEVEDVMRTCDNVFPDGEWPEGYDYNRHSTYKAFRIFLAIKSATGFDAIANSPHFKNTAKYIIYGTKPNGLTLSADDNDWPYLATWEHSALLMYNEEFKDSHTQYFINNIPFERFKMNSADQYQILLWYNPEIKEKPLTELPVSRIFRGKGLVMARSGWDFDQPGKLSNNSWIAFHCGDYQGDHVHFDNNSFVISYKGEQALDAGRYDGDWGIDDWTQSKDSSRIRKSQFFNYYRRTIAHNTILVMDPNEKMNLNLLNDGGQVDLLRVNGVRNVPEDYDQGNFPSEDGIATCDWATNPGRWETGDITSYKATKDFMYVRGDATKSYSAAKMNSYIRQLVYLQPNIVVVMDRVVSTNPDFKKTWLLHTVNEPVIYKKAKSIEVKNEDGRLYCISVLPAKLNATKIGGPGNEFLVDTTHFQCGLKSVINPEELHYGEIPGAWRVEINPSTASKEDYFLNVILISDKNSKEIPEVKVLSDSEKEISIQVSAKDGKSAVLNFTKGEKPSAHIKLMNGTKVLVDEQMPEGVELETGRDN